MVVRFCLSHLTIPILLISGQAPFVTVAVTAITTKTNMIETKKTAKRLEMELPIHFML